MLGPHRDDEFFDRERLRVVARGCFVRTPRVENKVELARTQVLPEVEFHGSQRRAHARCLLENIDCDERVAVPRADEEGRTPKMPQVHVRRTEASLVTSKRNGFPRPTDRRSPFCIRRCCSRFLFFRSSGIERSQRSRHHGSAEARA